MAMQDNIFKVFPSTGYLNTQYTIIPNEGSIVITIAVDDHIIREIPVSDNKEHITLDGFKNPGTYTFSSGNQTQTVIVDDAFRYGDGSLKNVVCFDDSNEVFILMSDRFHIFNILDDTIVFTQNHFSAENVIKVNENIFLLKSQYGANSNEYEYTVFDGINHSIGNSGIGELLYESKNNGLYYLKHDGVLSIYQVKTMDLISSYHGSINYSYPERCFYVCDRDNCGEILRIDGETGTASSKHIENCIGATKEGVFVSMSERRICFSSFNSTNDDCWFNIPIDTDEISIENCIVSQRISLSEDNKQSRLQAITSETFNQRGSERLSIWQYQIYKIYPNFNTGGFAIEVESRIEEAVLTKDNSVVTIQKNNTQSFIIRPHNRGTIDRYALDHLKYHKYGALINYNNIVDGVYNQVFISGLPEGNVVFRDVELAFSKYGAITVKSIGNETKELSFFSGRRRITVNTKSTSTYKLHHDDTIIEYRPTTLEKTLFYDMSNQTSLSCPSKSTSRYREDQCLEFLSYNGTNVSFWDGSSYTIPGEPLVYSVCKDKAAIEIKKKILICLPTSDGKSTIKHIKFDYSNNYQKAHMSPDGRHIAFTKDGKSFTYYDIETSEEVSFGNQQFVKFTADGNAICADGKDNNRAIHILDPDTMDIISNRDYRFYCFSSPDGSIVADTQMKYRYFLRPEDTEVDFSAYNRQRQLLEYEEPAKNTLARMNRINLYNKYRAFLEGRNRNAENFSLEDLYYIQYYVVIRRLSDGKVLELPIDSLSFLNYVAFSFDNRYVGIVGKPANAGYIHIYELNDDFSSFSEKYKSTITRYATWSCGFASNELFGTSDSLPETYLLNLSYDKKQDIPNRIPGKSWLCFSRSGRLVALSRQGYRAITNGGIGHIPSNMTYIMETANCKILATYCDHAGFIKSGTLVGSDKNILMASFSDDESRLMTIGNDGVIIIRNLNL